MNAYRVDPYTSADPYRGSDIEDRDYFVRAVEFQAAELVEKWKADRTEYSGVLADVLADYSPEARSEVAKAKHRRTAALLELLYAHDDVAFCAGLRSLADAALLDRARDQARETCLGWDAREWDAFLN